MHPKMKAILKEADKHNAEIKYKAKKQVRNELGTDIEEGIWKIKNKISRSTIGIHWKPGQYEKIFGKK